MSGEIGKYLINYLIRKARRTPPNIIVLSGARTARYPVAARGFGWGLLVLTAAFGGLLTYKVPQHMRLGFAIGTSAFIAMVLAMVVDFTRVSLTWTDQCIVFTSPWRGTRTLRWEEVTEVRFAPVAGWFVVRTRDALTIRPAMMMGGLEEFFAELKTRGQPSLHSPIDTALRLRAERCE
ncbi:MAG: hypothetical protein ABI548_29030 [Polyangiaceae bacterium]